MKCSQLTIISNKACSERLQHRGEKKPIIHSEWMGVITGLIMYSGNSHWKKSLMFCHSFIVICMYGTPATHKQMNTNAHRHSPPIRQDYWPPICDHAGKPTRLNTRAHSPQSHTQPLIRSTNPDCRHFWFTSLAMRAAAPQVQQKEKK